ncbi:hypothetical protein [Janibacter limosus]|jgi:hypothetical protein|uniref:hypothetical protein n=1 Tax=Janibacter limosus TaxID=53458 RepID=UPI00083346B8|nr:hypothetical protein [Janibacter limosus]
MALGSHLRPDPTTREEFDIRARNARMRMATIGRRLDNVHNHPHNDLTPDDIVALHERLAAARAGLDLAEQQVESNPSQAALLLDEVTELADGIGDLALIRTPVPGPTSPGLLDSRPGSTPILDAIFWLIDGGFFRRR